VRAGYLADSSYSVSSGLELQTALGRTDQGLVDHPELFRGFLTHPHVAAAGVLAVADVAANRYADVGLAKRLANLDPVVTVSGDRLRFESFSACNGVHARFDVLPDGIESGDARFGTTNVDVSQPLRTALAGVAATTLMHLAVGDDELRVSTPEATFTEEQVVLPERWVRAFGEAPTSAASMAQVAELRGPAVAAFLGSLPRAGSPGPTLHLRPVAGTLRPMLDAGPGTVLLDGTARLGGAARVVRFASRMAVHQDPHGATAWVIDVPGGRLSLQLTAAAYRGFSGNGSLLSLLARPEARRDGQRVAGALRWEPQVDRAALAGALAMTTVEVEGGLAWLGASGRVGYDVAEETWFHRELPVADLDAVLRRHPRLVSAQRLVDTNAVRLEGNSWHVRGSTTDGYTVRADAGGDLVCDCAWADDHRAGRGPCKHVLAVLVVSRDG
jgi:hypothetical protein